MRVPGSARRTTSIEMDTRAGLVLVGRARDLVTPTHDDAIVVDEAAFRARLGDFVGGQIIEEFTAARSGRYATMVKGPCCDRPASREGFGWRSN